MVRFRFSHGFTTIPLKPELAMVSWKVKFVSGTLMKARLIAAA